mgnify:CR=1 FL=1
MMIKQFVKSLSAFLFIVFSVVMHVSHSNAQDFKTSESRAGFVKIKDAIADIQTDVRYFGEDNFMGVRVTGYRAPIIYITKQAAQALKKVQDELRPMGLSLKVFDAYRPQRAVDHFARWALDLEDTKTKAKYYPNTSKNRLFKDGYIARQSGHTRGSTIDLTIVSHNDDGTNTELDMGTGWDLLGKRSHIDAEGMTGQQRANRLLLRTLMMEHGFRPYDKEWWHFTLEDEPFPNTYFDFLVQ